MRTNFDANGIILMGGTCRLVELETKNVSCMPTPSTIRAQAASAVDWNKRYVFVFGGIRMLPSPHTLERFDISDITSREIECFDIESKTWIPVETRLPIPISRASAVAVRDGKILICGGYDKYTGYLTACMEFDTSTHEVSVLPRIWIARASHAIVNYRGRVIIIGGVDGTDKQIDECEQYTPSINQWDFFAPIAPPYDWRECDATVCDDRIFVCSRRVNQGIYLMYDGTAWRHIMSPRWTSSSPVSIYTIFIWLGRACAIDLNRNEMATYYTEEKKWIISPFNLYISTTDVMFIVF